MAKEIKITLKRSRIGRPEKHCRTLVGLKLTKTNRTIRVKDTPQIRGMVRKVSHLVEVEEID
ncbi:MAG: 50S ribosomal protein L30 [Pseudomonadota bacterium]